MSRPYGQVSCVRDKLHAVEVYSRKIGSGLVDMGKPLSNAMRVTKDGIAKSDSNIVGMSILQANTLDEALEMVKDHPHLHWAPDCPIVVLEELPIPELEATPHSSHPRISPYDV